MPRRRRCSLSTGATSQAPGPGDGPEVDAQGAAEALDIELGLLAGVDAMGFARALGEMGLALLTRPSRLVEPTMRAGQATIEAARAAVTRAWGLSSPGPIQPNGHDRRFRDPAWQDNPWFFGLGQGYLIWSRYLHELVEAAELDDRTAEKAAVVVGQGVDAMAPTNFLVTNPTALRRAVETGGLSVLRGARNFFRDLASNGGRPSQVDRSAFKLGENLAATPGKVVFRNDLMELIQYAPQTETVYETPLLLSPPWINKYYIMDLAPGRSFVEWAVQQGHTVFAISYRNPDESMREVALDDYLLHGLGRAMDVVRKVTGADQVNVAGLCVGGTLAVALLAYLAHGDERPVRSVTLLNTLVDFSDPGPLGAFTDPDAVERLERRMAETGYLDAGEMAVTFDFLRANDLIWKYVASGWLMGEPPPAFDILAWNADPTRVSEATHSAYLRSCYLENQLAKSEMHLGGRRLNLDEIEADTYILAAQGDHITPWRSSYATTSLLPSQMRFVLTSSGHIAGIVNPPSPKRRYWTNDHLPEEADAWLAEASEHTGSWWGDWTEWIAARAGERREARPVGSSAYPPLIDAPGTYVRRDPQ